MADLRIFYDPCDISNNEEFLALHRPSILEAIHSSEKESDNLPHLTKGELAKCTRRIVHPAGTISNQQKG
jgi:hypothetical protein